MITKTFKILDHCDDEFVKENVKDALLFIELTDLSGKYYYEIAGVVSRVKSRSQGVWVKCSIFDKFKDDLSSKRIKHKSVFKGPMSPRSQESDVCMISHPALLLSEY